MHHITTKSHLIQPNPNLHAICKTPVNLIKIFEMSLTL